MTGEDQLSGQDVDSNGGRVAGGYAIAAVAAGRRQGTGCDADAKDMALGRAEGDTDREDIIAFAAITGLGKGTGLDRRLAAQRDQGGVERADLSVVGRKRVVGTLPQAKFY